MLKLDVIPPCVSILACAQPQHSSAKVLSLRAGQSKSAILSDNPSMHWRQILNKTHDHSRCYNTSASIDAKTCF